MNLIEIAESLKDLPDQYLFQEVQAPTGNFPTYLVITELGRRKRMRDSAMKQMPETTVAEDLTQRQQAMAQVDQNMIQQAGGLNAMPQAQQDLAAMDMMSAQMAPEMAQEVPAMAGGGMVSFRQGGDVIRAFNGLPEEMFASGVDQPSMPRQELVDLMTLPELQQYNRTGVVPERLRSRIGTTPIESGSFLGGLPISRAPAQFPAAVAPAAQPTAQPTARPTAQPAGQPAVRPQAVPSQAQGSMFTLPTQEEQAAAAKAGLELYERAMPDRLGEFRADLQSRQAEMEGRRGSNINEALIQAGLGMMGSSSPNFLQAVSEGAMGGLRGYKEGMKEIREGQNAIRQSQLEMAKAEMLRDQDKFKAARDAENRAIELRVKGAELTKLGQLLPAQINALNAQAEAYKTRGTKPQVADQMLVISTRKQALDALGITQNEYNSDRTKRAAVDRAVAQALEEKGFAYPSVNIAPRTIDFQVP